MQDKFLRTMSLLLNKDVLEMQDISMHNNKEWTSVKHLEIIMTTEEVFNVRFNPEDIPQLISLNTLYNKIVELSEDNK